ncbi:uncharacterized protein LOC143208356 isoform X2 [Lasioglossum baleicum]|uniref:uncharacterized protein LOC143208356 isoform X2 n=1 Tax=Lasioglossum baleicum TaxID=434251 RepID=UPI003FCD9490
MSCVHHQSSNPSGERCYYEGQYNRYANLSYTPSTRSRDVFRSARGDQTFPDARMQNGRVSSCRQETRRNVVDPLILEKMQAKLRHLEDSNVVVQTRNQTLVTENKMLLSKLEEERNEVRRVEERMVCLREELDREKLRLLETKEAAEQCNHEPVVEASGTSTTDMISKVDRGVQVWAVCSGCQRKLESCEKLPPTVTITKSELDELERDMQTLRDTIIAREEAWDKAMEREENDRQQLIRLTTETITARHLSETRSEELRAATKTLSEKESELKMVQKDNAYLQRLIVKLYTCQLSYKDDHQRTSFPMDMNEKDQRYIEDAVRRATNGKNKQKTKPKNSSERNPNHGNHQASPRERNAKSRDQPGPLKEPKR